MSKNEAQNTMKLFFFGGHFFMEFFSGKFGRNRAKLLRTPKICLLPHLMCCTTTYLGIFWYCSRDFWSCPCESLVIQQLRSVSELWAVEQCGVGTWDWWLD